MLNSPINREFYLAKGTEKFIYPDDDDDDPEEQEENSQEKFPNS
jgi:hypothetical protein